LVTFCSKKLNPSGDRHQKIIFSVSSVSSCKPQFWIGRVFAALIRVPSRRWLMSLCSVHGQTTSPLLCGLL